MEGKLQSHTANKTEKLGARLLAPLTPLAMSVIRQGELQGELLEAFSFLAREAGQPHPSTQREEHLVYLSLPSTHLYQIL